MNPEMYRNNMNSRLTFDFMNIIPSSNINPNMMNPNMMYPNMMYNNMM